MPTLKQKLLQIYYQTQAGYTLFSWLAGALTSASVIILAIHFIVPTIPTWIASVALPICALIFFYFAGGFGLKSGAYGASQSFGKDEQNPARLNWLLEISRADVTIAETELLMKLAKKNKIESGALKEKIKRLIELKEMMKKLINTT